MLRFSELACFFAVLITLTAVTASDAKVLRSTNRATTVRVFKDPDALRRFNRLSSIGFYRESVIAPLVSCKAPQGSKIEVLGSGHRTVFVRIVDGNANGCEGTVFIGSVRDQ